MVTLRNLIAFQNLGFNSMIKAVRCYVCSSSREEEEWE